MDEGLRYRNRWNTAHLSGYGALLGIVLGMLQQFCHVFCPASWLHSPGENLFTHVLIEVVIGAFAGATLLAAISALRNWLMQDR
jgi:hypothetical protein